MQSEKKAYEICKAILERNLNKEGLYAGSSHFTDCWARDAFFSCFAFFQLRKYQQIKKILELFLRFQRSDGMIPLRIGRGSQLLKLIGIRSTGKLKPAYNDDKGSHSALDGTILFITIFSTYIKKAKDKIFLEKHRKKLNRALGFLETNEQQNSLLFQHPYCDWADSIKKKGTVLYTNVLYYQALKTSVEILQTEQAEVLSKKSEDLKQIINKELWNPIGYFSDWKNKGNVYTYFNLESNLLAILSGLTNKEQTKAILDFCKKHLISNNLVNSVLPPYSKKHIYPPFFLINMQSYHNGMRWMWHTNLYILVLAKQRRKRAAAQLLKLVSDIILKQGTPYEVYDQKARPIHKLFYRSEPDFSWSAATFIQAYHAAKDLHQRKERF